jgi:hypothetical protein
MAQIRLQSSRSGGFRFTIYDVSSYDVSAASRRNATMATSCHKSAEVSIVCQVIEIARPLSSAGGQATVAIARQRGYGPPLSDMSGSWGVAKW